tara:strand:- start:114 stop:845 length:732 start_codon:yes stop_codon:yes gene_type:complete
VTKIKQKIASDFKYSQNFYLKKRKKKEVKFIIIHYTGMRSEKKALQRLTSSKSNVSCNYFIRSNGKIIEVVPDEYASWHAGVSRWKNKRFLNKSSIGIEIQNPGHQNKYVKFSEKQINSILKLLKFLVKKYKIHKNFVLGHSDISPDRKKDPGEKFPWKTLSQNKLSVWHNLSNAYLMINRKKKLNFHEIKMFHKILKKIGYRGVNQKKLNKTFQRRFRPDLINGFIDQECFVIAKNLIKLGI